MHYYTFKRKSANDTSKREHLDTSEWYLKVMTAFKGKEFPFLIDNDLLVRLVLNQLNV